MSSIFTPTALDLLKQQISQSLTDTFHIMFNFEIYLSDDQDNTQNNQALKSCIELRAGENVAFLNVTIPSLVVAQLTSALGAADIIGQESSMGQDITCEIANIIGHAVRSHFISQSGVTLNVGLPQVGNVHKQSHDNGVLSLHFLSKAHEHVDLDFVYSNQA